MRTVTVRVRLRDIVIGAWAGRRGDPTFCPVACALQRDAPVTRDDVTGMPLESWLVGSTSVSLLGSTMSTAELPERAQDFIAAFDGPVPEEQTIRGWRRVRALLPFSFELEVP